MGEIIPVLEGTLPSMPDLTHAAAARAAAVRVVHSSARLCDFSARRDGSSMSRLPFVALTTTPVSDAHAGNSTVSLVSAQIQRDLDAQGTLR